MAKIKITWLGGSSKVFKSALKAPVESIWTSSIIYILYLQKAGIKLTLSLKERISSTPLLLAASISTISLSFKSKDLQIEHSPQISLVKLRQLTAWAKILAVLVLPVPRGPVNK